jgi:hypothetical protein
MRVQRTVVLPRKSNKRHHNIFKIFFLACRVVYRATIVTTWGLDVFEDSFFLNGRYVPIVATSPFDFIEIPTRYHLYHSPSTPPLERPKDMFIIYLYTYNVSLTILIGQNWFQCGRTSIWWRCSASLVPQFLICLRVSQVLAMVPGYLAAVRVGSGTVAPVRFWNRQGTEPPKDERTRTAPKTTVFWPGFAYSRASFSRTQNFGSN